jgi:hypothetical protein
LVGDNTIIVTLSTIKTIKELFKNLLLSLPASDEVFVFRDIIDGNNIPETNLTASILIQHCESLVNHRLLSCSQLISLS